MQVFKNFSFHSFTMRRSGKTQEQKPVKKLDNLFIAEFYRINPVWFFVKKMLLFIAGTVVLFHSALILYALIFSVLFSFINPPFTSLMAERYITRHYVPKRIYFIPLNKIPAYIPAMYIRIEDKNFYQHSGIDLAAIKRAYELNQKYDTIILGGSTITQQLTRTLFLVPYRNYLRKYMEAVIAVILDGIMTKERILELYINYIEWGKGVYGLGAAVKYHYNKPIAYLTREEFCRLAAIIQNPIKYDVNNFYTLPSMSQRYHALLGS